MNRFNGAITFSLWKFFQLPYRQFEPKELQWGHNFFVMEILMDCDESLGWTGFNGAITFSLWKFSFTFGGVAMNNTLQWGHNFFVMEIVPSARTFPTEISLQWGHNFFVMEIRNWEFTNDR